jgi:hypothetical protein
MAAPTAVCFIAGGTDPPVFPLPLKVTVYSVGPAGGGEGSFEQPLKPNVSTARQSMTGTVEIKCLPEDRFCFFIKSSKKYEFIP